VLDFFMVIPRIFEKAVGRIRRAKPQEIHEAYDRNEEFFSWFENAHERFLTKAAESMILSQPFVLKYMADALYEAPQDADPVILTEDEMGQLVLVIKTVVDLLDELAQQS
jgi:hypothetical protein